jgi:hypothetical protein
MQPREHRQKKSPSGKFKREKIHGVLSKARLEICQKPNVLLSISAGSVMDTGWWNLQ